MTDRVVVDSCVAIKWFIAETGFENAKSLLRPNLDLIAPDIVLMEIANALWKNERLKRVSKELVDRALANAPRYFQELWSTRELTSEAIDLARLIDHPVYDCIYAIVARRAGSPLVTSDATLLRKLSNASFSGQVVDLADWPP